MSAAATAAASVAELKASSASTEDPGSSAVEVDHDLDTSVGRLAGNYPCVYDNTNGTLFAGSGGVSFVGWVFFFEKRVDIRWNEVLQVVKTERNDGTSSISFIMRDNDLEYEFNSMQHSERVWATLVTLHNEALHEHTHNIREPLVTPLRQSLRRMSTDPIHTSSTAITTPKPSHSNSSPSATEAAYIAAATIASNDDFRSSVSSRNVAASSVARRQSLMNSHIMAERDEQGATLPSELKVDLQEAWKELQAGGADKKSYGTSAIHDKVLPCNLDVFFDTFVSDDAPFTYKAYMEIKDSDVTVTPWKQQGDDANVYMRTIEYSHPVNAPLAPPMARARKEQRYRRYGNAGISIETDTYVQDVPMADCFYVTDRVLVEPNPDDAVVILAEFDIVFVKSTMFRSMIANTTKSEFLKWFQGLEVYWSEALAPPEETPEEKAARRQSSIRRSSLFGSMNTVETVLVKGPPTPVAVVPPQTALSASSIRPMILLLIIVLAMQSWIMFEMMGMKQALRDLQVLSTRPEVPGTSCPTLDEESKLE